MHKGSQNVAPSWLNKQTHLWGHTSWGTDFLQSAGEWEGMGVTGSRMDIWGHPLLPLHIFHHIWLHQATVASALFQALLKVPPPWKLPETRYCEGLMGIPLQQIVFAKWFET